jgi:transcriptional antiterminator NusG
VSDDQQQFDTPAEVVSSADLAVMSPDETSAESTSVPSGRPSLEEPAIAEDYDSVMTAEEIAAEAAAEEAAVLALGPRAPVELIEDGDEEISLNWYILKVQSNRERSVAAALQRKVKIEGIDRYFGEICVPTEKVTEFKAGKKKIVERKLWPGYIAVQMHVNDATWFAIRETSGIGDFTGASGKPSPMQPHEIAMITKQEVEESTESPKLNIKFKVGDKVKVKDGNFESFEGEVGNIDEASGKVSIMISIFGRSTPVELEYWQVETI